jgi:multimeric flavodoxin WrbA
MGKKVLFINGSFRKKNTYQLLEQIKAILNAKGIETEDVNLFDYEIKDCQGCEGCVTESGCCLSDDMPVLMEKIMKSDGVVYGSPVYMAGVTSRFKSFADRTNKWIHKPETAGKAVMFVATTASTGLKETKQFFETYGTGIGARKGDFVSRTSKTMGNQVQEKELSKFLSLLETDKKEYSPAPDEIIMFTVQKIMALQSNGEDRTFWETQKWLDKPYYYPCNMNPIKVSFGKMMFKIISKAMS